MVLHWRRNPGARSGLYMAINGTGALATGFTVVIVLLAKFREGAWITVLIIPLLILLMRAVHRHYQAFEAETHVSSVHLSHEPAPLAILPVANWNRASEAALQFACSLTPEVRVLHVENPDQTGQQTCDS